MKVLAKQTGEAVRSYKRSTKGFEAVEEVKDPEDAYNLVSQLEDNDFYPQDDGSVWDANGNEVFDPNYPDTFDFGDYYYTVIDTDRLDEYHDAHKIQALEEAGMRMNFK